MEILYDSKLKWLIILLAILVFSSCNSDREPNTKNSLTLSPQGTISYHLDSTTAHELLNLGTLGPNGDVFYLLNRDRGRVHFYDAQTQDKIDYIHFSRDPKNNLSGASGVKVLSQDLSWVFHRPLVISLFSNRKNEVLLRKNINLPMYQDRWSLREAYFAGFAEPIEVSDSTLIVNLAPIITRYRLLDENASIIDYPFLSKINLNKGELIDLPIYYPPSTNNAAPSLVFRVFMQEAKDYFIIGFVHDPVIYKVDKVTGQLLGQYYVRSKYPIDFTPTKGITDGKSLAGFQEMNYRYFQVLYDPYRKVFYRQVRHPNFEYELGTSYYSSMERMEGFSVMIFDEEFKKLGEVDFPPKTYGYQAWYVGPEGLYISKSNYNNPEMREDFMDFDLFVLTPLEE
jgi:hypothetical protein